MDHDKPKCPKWKPKGSWNCSDKGHYKNKCPKPAKVTTTNETAQNQLAALLQLN